MLTLIVCPHCQARLTLPAVETPGPMLCVKCRGVVAAPPLLEEPTEPPAATPLVSLWDEPDGLPTPPTLRGRRRGRLPSSFGVWWLATIGGLSSLVLLLVLFVSLTAELGLVVAASALVLAGLGAGCALISLPTESRWWVGRQLVLLLAVGGG